MNTTTRWKNRGQWIVGALVGVVLLAVSAMSSASKTYYIDEGVTFDGTSGCPAISNVNTITATLQTSLNTDSWTGSRYVDALAWPQDFWEACSTTYGSGGLDSTYADTKSLAVYAGHGNVRYLAFGQAHNGACAIDFTNNMRLGEMSGVSAAFGMWLACDVLQGSEMGSNMYQRLRQQAGWQNSISINDNEPRDFYNSTHTYTNADAWLNTMGTNFGGSRDAIISTFDSSSIANCWTAHHAAKLKDNAYTSPIGNSPACGGGQPLYYYCYEHRVSP